MIDIHNHILFGLDDGAKTIENAKKMLEYAYRDGIQALIFTPHYVSGFNQYHLAQMNDAFNELVMWTDEVNLNIKLYLGNEALLDEGLIEDLDEGHCMSLAGSRYMLVECYKHTPIYAVKQLLFQIGLKGYVPILAHCERMVENKDDLSKLIEIKNMGCLLQVNAGTLLKPESRWQKKWLHTLIKDNVISFVASDAHNLDTRKPELKQAYDLVIKKFNQQTADDLFINHPNKLILNEDI